MPIFKKGGGGGGSTENSFETIQTPAGTSPVADGGTDTLTLTSTDSTVTITGTAASDTIDFSCRVATELVSGIVSTAAQNIAGAKSFTGACSFTNATTVPLTANNGAGTNSIAVYKDNGTTILELKDGGDSWYTANPTSTSGTTLRIENVYPTAAVTATGFMINSTGTNGAGSANHRGFHVRQWNDGYNGTGAAIGVQADVLSISGGGDMFNVTTPAGNYGGFFHATGTTSDGHSYGVVGRAYGSSNANIGVAGMAPGNGRSVGALGQAASGGTAGYFKLGVDTAASDIATTVGACLVANNGSAANTIIEGRDNNTVVFQVADGGKGSLITGASTTLGGIGVCLKVNTTEVGNVGAGEDDLITYAVPASSLGTNGDQIEVIAFGTFANNANNKTVTVYFGATAVLSTGAIAYQNGSWQLVMTIIRTGATAQIASAYFISDVGVLFGSESLSKYTTAAETLSGAITVKCTGTATDNNDIIQKGLIVKWHPAN